MAEYKKEGALREARGANKNSSSAPTAAAPVQLAPESEEDNKAPANLQATVRPQLDPKPQPRTYGNYQDMIDFMTARRAEINLPTREQLAREQRRRRSESIISGIADGARAISNLITTNEYAPDMYKPESSLTARMAARYERLKKERAADEDRYYNYTMGIAKLKDAQEDKEYKRGRDALKDKLAAQAAAQDKATAEARIAYLRAQADAAAKRGDASEANRLLAEAKKAQVEFETGFAQEHGYKLGTARTGGGARSGGSRGGGGGGVKEYPAYNPATGETIIITAKDSKHAWSQCPQGFTIRQEPSATVTDTTSGSGLRTKTTHQTTTKNSNDDLDGPRRGGTKQKSAKSGFSIHKK